MFFRETLGLLTRWRTTKEVYDKECATNQGFCIKLGDPNSRKATFAEFRKVTSR